MIGQSKNIFQAEIDAACELIDFLRFNVNLCAKYIKINLNHLKAYGIKWNIDH